MLTATENGDLKIWDWRKYKELNSISLFLDEQETAPQYLVLHNFFT